MNVRTRAIGVAAVLVATVGLSGAVTSSVSAAAPRSVVSVSPLRESTRSVAFLVLDDRDLARRTAGWSSVASLTAYRSTLTCSSARRQTLRVRPAVEAGGDIRFRTGPGWGSVAVLVGGTVVARASTASSTFGYRRISFDGAGRVDIRVTSVNKRVCVDDVRVVLPDVIPGG